MLIFALIIGWIVCGLLNVVLMARYDKSKGYHNAYEADTAIILFLLGPIALAIFLFFALFYALSQLLKVVYDKVLGKNET